MSRGKKWSSYQNKRLINLLEEYDNQGYGFNDSCLLISDKMHRSYKAVQQQAYKLRRKNTEPKKRVKSTAIANDNKQSLFRDFAIGAVIGITLIVTTLILL